MNFLGLSNFEEHVFVVVMRQGGLCGNCLNHPTHISEEPSAKTNSLVLK